MERDEYSTLNRPPLYRGGEASVPREIAVCPECQGSLTARSQEWEIDTGRPNAAALAVDCDADTGRDEEWNHSYWQSDWQPVIDAVAKWCDALQ